MYEGGFATKETCSRVPHCKQTHVTPLSFGLRKKKNRDFSNSSKPDKYLYLVLVDLKLSSLIISPFKSSKFFS